MGDLGVFEAMDNAGKLSAEAAANDGFELEKSIDRAIFRAKERFGAYLANPQDFNERWAQVRPEVIKVIAEVTTPTPGVIRRVGAALRPPAPKAKAPAKQVRPSSVKTAAAPVTVEASVEKTAWSYDKVSYLYTSNDPMQKFACPGCGTEQEHIGFNKCAGCDRTWNSWAVRQAGTDKTSASTYVLMAREIKMRDDKFKLAAQGNVKISAPFQKDDKKEEDEGDEKKDDDSSKKTASLSNGDEGEGFDPQPHDTSKNGQPLHENQRPKLTPSKKTDSAVHTAAFPQDGPPPSGPQPGFGTMPGDNSGATGAPVAPQQPATPMAAAAGDRDGDGDVAGGVTEDSPIDQIQDALQDAIVALKDVQMLSVNPALLGATASNKAKKVATLRTAMDRFWKLHKDMNYVAGMLAKEANEAIRTADPRITSEAQFIQGFNAAARNEPLPEKTGRAWLEGYVAFHKQGEDYSTGANVGGDFVPTGKDETAKGNDGSQFLQGTGTVPANEVRGDSGPFDTSQPAAREFANQTDKRNAESDRDERGQSSTLQPTSARRTLPKGR